MRKLLVHMQTTLDGRIATAGGGLWEPFCWGEDEMRHINGVFRTADTWAFGRVVYASVAPWWTIVARGDRPPDLDRITPAMAEFGAIFSRLAKVVYSTTLEAGDDREVVRADVAGDLARRKRKEGGRIILSCGPAMLGSLAAVPGLIDEYLVAVHPAVITAGPRLFERVGADLALELVHAKVFDGGCVALHYRSRRPGR